MGLRHWCWSEMSKSTKEGWRDCLRNQFRGHQPQFGFAVVFTGFCITLVYTVVALSSAPLKYPWQEYQTREDDVCDNLRGDYSNALGFGIRDKLQQRLQTVLGTGRIAREYNNKYQLGFPSSLERPIETSCSHSGKHECCNESSCKKITGTVGYRTPEPQTQILEP